MKNSKLLKVVVSSLMVSSVCTSSLSAINANANVNDVSNTPVVLPTKYIENGDFENTYKNRLWSLGTNSALDSSNGIDGTRCGKLTPGGVSILDAAMHQMIHVEKNTDYKVKAKIKTSRANVRYNLAIRGIKNSNTDNGIVKQTVFVSQDDGWNDVELSFNSGNHARVKVQVVVWVEKSDASVSTEVYNATNGANIFIDNVDVEKTTASNYTELWRDDFDQNQLDPSNWRYELGHIRQQERQLYVNDEKNVFVKDGNLTIRATKVDEYEYQKPNGTTRTIKYNSGSIETFGLQDFMYGKIEMRAKMPKGQGVFPAFWTLGSEFTHDGIIENSQGTPWPVCGEIDISEITGGKKNGIASNPDRNSWSWGTLHYGESADSDPGQNFADADSANGLGYYDNNGKALGDEFHKYGIIWSKNTIQFYLDDYIWKSIDISNLPQFQRPQYIKLNLAMGGIENSFPGTIDETITQSDFVVDYVSYSQNEQQKADQEAYESELPTITGTKDITMLKGNKLPDVLSGVSAKTKAGNDAQLDFTVENEASMLHGGKTDVNNTKIANLPAGTYNIIYTAKDPVDGKIINAKFKRAFAKLHIIEPANKTELDSNITKAKELITKVDVYTEESINALKTVLEQAEAININELALQSEVDETNTALLAAIDNLEKIPEPVDTSKLTEELTEAKKLLEKTDIYSIADLEKLAKVISEIEAKLKTGQISEAEVVQLIEKIQATVDSLQEITKPVDTSKLTAKLAEAKKYLNKTDVYTENTLKNLSVAIKVAEVGLADKNLTEAQVSKLVKDLQAAINNLKKITTDQSGQGSNNNKVPVKPETSGTQSTTNKNVSTGDTLNYMTSLTLLAGSLLLIKGLKNRKE